MVFDKLDNVGLNDNKRSTKLLDRFKLFFFFFKFDMWHMTCYKWHVTHDTWNVTCDTKGWWTLCKKFSSLALTVWELWFLAAPSSSRRLGVGLSVWLSVSLLVCPSVRPFETFVKKWPLEYQIVTKIYLKPTYLPTYLHN